MKRRYQTTLALCTLLGLSAHTANAAEFLVTPIPAITGLNGVTATGINNNGQVAGYGGLYSYINPGGLEIFQRQAFVYENGITTPLALLPNCTDSTAAAINAGGQIVGLQTDTTKQTHPFLYSNHTVTELPLTGTGAEPHAINDNGDIVGNYGSFSGTAFLYHNGVQSDPNTLAGPNRTLIITNPLGINNSGIIVGIGHAYPISAPVFEKPIRWNQNILTDLAPNITSTGGSSATAVNTAGQIVGYTNSSNLRKSFLYSSEQLTYLGQLPTTGAPESVATALNSTGQIVGYALTGEKDQQQEHAWIYRDGQMYDLNRLVTPGTSELNSATGINDSGQIIVNSGSYASFSAYLLTPLIGTVAAAPTNLSGAPVPSDGSTIVLNWTAATGAGYYKIYRSATPTGPMVAIAESAISSYADTGLQAGTSYTYTVASINSHGVGPKTAPVTVTTPAIAPTDAPSLTAHKNTPNSNILIWTSCRLATGYQLYRAGPNGVYAKVATTTTQLQVSDSGLQPGTTYTYYVVAVNAYGAGPKSNIESIRTILLAPSTAPVLTATAGSNSEVHLTWTSVPTSQAYVVERSTTPGGAPVGSYVSPPSGNPTTISFTDYPNLPPGTALYYTVLATNDGGQGPNSNQVSVKTMQMPTDAPALTAHGVNATEIDLNWGKIAFATKYRILRSVSLNGPYQFVAETTDASYKNLSLPPATTYYYTVSGFNNAGVGPHRTPVPATTLALPSAPSNLTAEAISCVQINLHWTASSGASSYAIYRSTAAGKDHLYVGTTTALQFADKGLAPGTRFYYVVVATNSHGRSPNSNEATAQTLALPSAPLNLTATAQSGHTIKLTWTAALGATYYQVFRGTAAGKLHSYIGQTTGQGYLDTNLTAGVTYYYIVTSVNSHGTGPKSNEARAKAF